MLELVNAVAVVECFRSVQNSCCNLIPYLEVCFSEVTESLAALMKGLGEGVHLFSPFSPFGHRRKKQGAILEAENSLPLFTHCHLSILAFFLREGCSYDL